MSHVEESIKLSVVKTGHVPDAAATLIKAHAAVRLPGSSTACIAVARADGILRVVNVGDSGLQVWKRNRPITSGVPLRLEEAARLWDMSATVPITTHKFNFPRQLAAQAEYSDTVADHGAIADFPLKGGELLIAATDGIWDNLGDEAIRTVLSRFDFEPCHTLVRMARARLTAGKEAVRVAAGIAAPARFLSSIPNVVPEDVSDAAFAAKKHDCRAQLLAMSTALAFAAQRVGKDPKAISPFAIAAKKEGLRFEGGKLDDATAVCALVLPDDRAVLNDMNMEMDTNVHTSAAA